RLRPLPLAGAASGRGASGCGRSLWREQHRGEERAAAAATVGLPRLVDGRPAFGRLLGHHEQRAIRVLHLAVHDRIGHACRRPARILRVCDLRMDDDADRRDGDAVVEQLERRGVLGHRGARLRHELEPRDILHAAEDRNIDGRLDLRHLEAREHIGLLLPDRDRHLTADRVERVLAVRRDAALRERLVLVVEAAVPAVAEDVVVDRLRDMPIDDRLLEKQRDAPLVARAVDHESSRAILARALEEIVGLDGDLAAHGGDRASSALDLVKERLDTGLHRVLRTRLAVRWRCSRSRRRHRRGRRRRRGSLRGSRLMQGERRGECRGERDRGQEEWHGGKTVADCA
ncbi:MAG: hypothetical protein RLY21_505, partial [Planctomycetota bacterium]